MLDLENSSVYFYTSVLNERKVFLDQLGKVAQLVGSVILYTNRLWVRSLVRDIQETTDCVPHPTLSQKSIS